MKKVRTVFLVLALSAFASSSPRPAAAGIDGRQVLIAAGIGAVVGLIIGLVKVLSTPKRTAATSPGPWARGVVLTF